MLPLLRPLPRLLSPHLSRGAKSSSFGDRLKKNAERQPFLYFGAPFIGLIVAGSFILAEFSATRYEIHAKRTHKLEKEEELGLERGRRRLSLQEEYWRLMEHEDQTSNETWEVKRVPRPNP